MAWKLGIRNEHFSVLLFNKSFFFLFCHTNEWNRLDWMEKSLPFTDILIIMTIGSLVCIIKWWNVLLKRVLFDVCDFRFNTFRVRGHRVRRQHWSIDPILHKYIDWPLQWFALFSDSYRCSCSHLFVATIFSHSTHINSHLNVQLLGKKLL